MQGIQPAFQGIQQIRAAGTGLHQPIQETMLTRHPGMYSHRQGMFRLIRNSTGTPGRQITGRVATSGVPVRTRFSHAPSSRHQGIPALKMPGMLYAQALRKVIRPLPTDNPNQARNTFHQGHRIPGHPGFRIKIRATGITPSHPAQEHVSTPRRQMRTEHTPHPSDQVRL